MGFYKRRKWKNHKHQFLLKLFIRLNCINLSFKKQKTIKLRKMKMMIGNIRPKIKNNFYLIILETMNEKNRLSHLKDYEYIRKKLFIKNKLLQLRKLK